MGILDWLKRDKQSGMPETLKAPWVRGDLGEPYCCTGCRKKANKKIDAITSDQTGKCFFCDKAVNFGNPNSGAAPFVLNDKLYCCCRNCKSQWKAFQNNHGRCFVCRTPYL